MFKFNLPALENLVNTIDDTLVPAAKLRVIQGFKAYNIKSAERTKQRHEKFMKELFYAGYMTPELDKELRKATLKEIEFFLEDVYVFIGYHPINFTFKPYCLPQWYIDEAPERIEVRDKLFFAHKLLLYEIFENCEKISYDEENLPRIAYLFLISYGAVRYYDMVTQEYSFYLLERHNHLEKKIQELAYNQRRSAEWELCSIIMVWERADINPRFKPLETRKLLETQKMLRMLVFIFAGYNYLTEKHSLLRHLKSRDLSKQRIKELILRLIEHVKEIQNDNENNTGVEVQDNVLNEEEAEEEKDQEEEQKEDDKNNYIDENLQFQTTYSTMLCLKNYIAFIT